MKLKHCTAGTRIKAHLQLEGCKTRIVHWNISHGLWKQLRISQEAGQKTQPTLTRHFRQNWGDGFQSKPLSLTVVGKRALMWSKLEGLKRVPFLSTLTLLMVIGGWAHPEDVPFPQHMLSPATFCCLETSGRWDADNLHIYHIPPTNLGQHYCSDINMMLLRKLRHLLHSVCCVE